MSARQKVEQKRYMYGDREFALRALKAHGGNISATARELGIPVSSLWQWARGKKYAGQIQTSRVGPIPDMWYFRGRVLPVLYLGETVPVDLAKLTQKQQAQLVRRLTLARAVPEGG